MDITVETLETPALTKAQLAELLFEQIGLNKRESKDMVDAFFDLVSNSLSPALATSRYVPNHRAPGATPAPARPSRSLRAGWSLSMPAKSSRSKFRPARRQIGLRFDPSQVVCG